MSTDLKERGLGIVIPFPTDRICKADVEDVKLSCIDCQNVYVGTKGLYCGAFNETIEFDDVAMECSEFTPF